jgi:hypothetical protein
MKKRKKKWPKNLWKKSPKSKPKKKVFAKARPEIFSNLFTFNKNTPLQKKNCTVFFLATGIMILKNTKIYTTMLAFFLFCDNALLCKAF